MKKLLPSFLLLAASMFMIIGCEKKNDVLRGNVYFHDADSLSYIAGFDKDTLYYIIRGPKLNMSHKTGYKLNKVNDSTFVVEVAEKPKFWDKPTWEIVMGKDKGFYSAESKNYYKYSPDKNILR